MTPSSVAEIKAWSKNPRTISDQQLEALKRSMDAHGDLGGVVFNLRTRHTVGGHQRIKVLDPSWKIEKHHESDKTGTVARGFIITPFGKFSYREVDWPLQKEMTANLAANKIQGEWDFEKLTPILKELHDLPELDLTGFTLREADIVISHGDAWNDPKDEETPSLPAKSMVKLGDLWQLGDHRLLCGDCTKPDSWKQLMDGEKAGMAFIDPPYGVAYDVRNKFAGDLVGGQYVKRMHKKNWGGVLKGDRVASDITQKSLPLFAGHSIEQWNAYVCCSVNLMVDLITWMRTSHIHYNVPNLVWDKEFNVPMWSRYHATHENIVWCGPGSRPGGHVRWFGPKNEVSVWHIPLDAFGAKRVHPTQKPVALYERAILNSSAQGDIISDFFAGSGSMIIAAAKHHRKAYCMELSPQFCHVIIKRWEQWSGMKAERLN